MEKGGIETALLPFEPPTIQRDEQIAEGVKRLLAEYGAG